MSYQLSEIVRLHGRDAIFATRYWRDRLLRAVQRQPTKSLVLCNSYPKSGTHLLYQILRAIPGLQAWDDIVSVQALSGIMNTASHIHWKLGSAPDNAIVRSHLMHCPDILDILSEFHCKTLFIYRDLRDVAVSHARWVGKEERIFLHEIYQHYEDFGDRLMHSIRGTPLGSPFSSNHSHPDIGTDFSRWQGWIDDPNTLALKFE
ncbi:MAG: sulfotransferase domain-containing protein, partial [Cyanobacteria bacterium J06639_1]